MSFLGLNEYQPLSPLEPEHPAIPKSAARAFLLSLVLPGIGQVYAKRQTPGWVTCAFFTLISLTALGALIRGQASVAGISIFCAISLYIFGFLDAYFAALEYNQGISTYLIGGNPRIAAILNFLTSGIGYFYLGDRGKGILIFVGLGILRQGFLGATGNNHWVNDLWLVLQAAMAYDAYRVARKRLLESFPRLANHSWRSAASGQLTPAIPIVLAIVLVLPVIGLMGFGVFAQNATSIRTTAADVQSTPQGTAYRNKDLGLKLLLPDDWQISQTAGETMINAHRTGQDDECKVILMRTFSWNSPEDFQKAMEREVAKKPGFSVYGHTNGTLGSLPAALMRVGVGTRLTEQVATAKIGMAVYTLIEVNDNNDDACASQLDKIRDSFTAQR
jgi:hypothetical protein